MKKLLIAFVAAVLIGAAALGWITRDTAATHPTLAQADLPSVIPTQAFYADPRSEWGYVASHDGQFTASYKASLTGRSAVVRDISSGDILGEFPADIQAIRWHPSEPKLRFFYQGDDWQADPWNPAPENWTRISPIALSGGWNKTRFAHSADERIRVWGRPDSSSPGHLYLVSQNGLEAEQIATGTKTTRYWVLDQSSVPVLRVDWLDDANMRVFRRSGADWTPLIDVHLDDVFHFVSDVRADGTVLVRSSRGRDRAVLVAFDTKTGAEEVLIENPSADIAMPTYLTHKSEPDVIRLGTDTFERVALTDRGQVFLDVLAQFPRPVGLGATAPSASGRYVTQALSSRDQSFVYLLIDLETGEYETLGEYAFRRFKDRLSQAQPVRFAARDGLEIPAIMTLPKGVKGPVPFIIHAHGGPAQHTGLGYGHHTQFLVNRGYGVLSVNFRGSTGFGKAFQAAGFRQFGRAMQDDLTDAARWLVAEGLADEQALAVMGASYGGYAAALAMTQDPGLFDAAIVEFPMLDPELQTRYHPGFWSRGMHGWWRYFGKAEQPEDVAEMDRYSPLQRVKDLHGPVLVLGGVRDQITSIEHVRLFEAAAKSADKDISVHYFADAGHGVQHWRDQLRRARLHEDFLAQHLGGRSGGFTLVEKAPSFID